MHCKSIVFSIILFSCLSLSLAENVKVLIEGATSIAKTDDNFVCATLDWWPTEKCNYNQCPWENVGLLNLNLQSITLANLLKAFNPVRIRVGGSLQDQVVYKVGKVEKCPHFKKRKNNLFGFSRGCLPMQRWDELNNLFNKTGAKVTFGLNALVGRKESKTEKGLWIGRWKSQNAMDFMKYTISKGYKIDSYEFGNGLCNVGIGAKVEARQYGEDITTLKNMVKELYPDSKTQPKILGPGGFYDEKWFNTFIQVSGQEVVDGITHHIYNLGAGDDPNLITKIQDPYYLNQVAQTYKSVSNSIAKFGSGSGAWVSESGGTYNNGGKDVSNTFANSFWYLDQLGMSSTFNHKVFCRQALVGGYYGLINVTTTNNETTIVPNPDYYGALLWHRLMGSTVLAAKQDATPNLRVYAHCAKKKPGISLILINLSKDSSFNVTVSNEENLNAATHTLKAKGFERHEKREEYHLNSFMGNIQSEIISLNDMPLVLETEGNIPIMNPELVDGSSPISVAPHSIVFVTIRDFRASACA